VKGSVPKGTCSSQNASLSPWSSNPQNANPNPAGRVGGSNHSAMHLSPLRGLGLQCIALTPISIPIPTPESAREADVSWRHIRKGERRRDCRRWQRTGCILV